VRIDIFTIFPAMFESPLQESILKRAQDSGRLEVAIHNIRDYTADRHHTTDDVPYGGGGGMVMKPEPIFAAVEAVLGERLEMGDWRLTPNLESPISNNQFSIPIILLTPQGRSFTQPVAQELAGHERLALICGRYEGVDERVRLGLATDEISIGDFVLTGGELPAMVLVDAVARLLPGVLGDPDAASDDSHATGLLEYPHYTRPPEYRGLRVPDVLLSGDHARIERWRREQALQRTWERRPDLLAKAELSEADKKLVEALEAEAQIQRNGAKTQGREA
jgi:tRNA (guanine37-N1)-methyltransferase